jgi:hypothetical protein
MIRPHRAAAVVGVFLLMSSSFLAASSSAADIERIRCWQTMPAPKLVYVTSAPQQTEPDARVMEQTVAGLLASQARSGNGGPMFWIDDKRPGADRWFDMFRKHVKPQVQTIDGDAWELLKRMTAEGRVRGYVLYRRDNTNDDDAPKDMSLNIAVSLCAPLQAVAIEESLKDRAEKLGLKMLEDARGKDHDWLIRRFDEKLSRDIVALEDPRRDHNMRDLAVAMSAVVVSSAPGGGFDAALGRAHPGGIVFGWDRYEEVRFVNQASQYGLAVVPGDWLINTPILMSGESGLDFPLPKPPAHRKTTDTRDEGSTRYVAFILSDGDNLCWTTSDLAVKKDVWGSPVRGTIPFGWGAAIMDSLQTDPYAIQYMLETATHGDDLIQYATGYCYLDHFGEKRGGAEALGQLMTRTRPYLQKIGATTMTSFVLDWRSDRANEAYAITARAIPELKGLFITQYHPYAAGEGAIRWIKRGDSTNQMAVLTPLIAMWHGVDDPVHFADIEPTAQAINSWAKRSLSKPEDRFTWIVVHCWSKFPFDGRELSCYDATLECAKLLDRNVKIVTPTELVDRLHAAHSAQ